MNNCAVSSARFGCMHKVHFSLSPAEVVTKRCSRRLYEILSVLLSFFRFLLVEI